MSRRPDLLFIECQRCRHKAQRPVTQWPLPAGACFRCSNCGNRERALIKLWHTGGSSSARIVSFPRGTK